MRPLARVLIGALALSAALFAGCRTQPVYEVVAAPIPLAGGRPATLDDIQKAIVRGGARVGWQVAAESPGRLTGRYLAGAHSATVDIEHDSKAYSIKMRDTSVRYDGAMVHRTYNAWVQNLDRSIRLELASLGQ